MILTEFKGARGIVSIRGGFSHFGILVGTPGVMICGMASQDMVEIGVSSRLGLILTAFQGAMRNTPLKGVFLVIFRLLWGLLV